MAYTLTYALNDDGQSYSVTGYTGTPENVVIPDTYNGYSVTNIYSGIFENCDTLETVTIGNNVTIIRYATFKGCANLTSVTIGNSVTTIGDSAFKGCASLAGIIMPNSITSINGYAFQDCTYLTSVTLSSNLERIGAGAFYNCWRLLEITIPASVTYMGDSAFYGCFNYGRDEVEKKVYITDLQKWCQIQFVNATANPLYYGRYLYLNGELVTELRIPDGITEIKPWAFIYLYSITSLTIPEGVESIGNFAFHHCKNITAIHIPASVTELGVPFDGCISVTSLTVASGNTTFFSVNNCVIDHYGHLILGCRNSIIPTGGSVTSIYTHAFAGYNSLTSIEIPNTVTEIGWDSFRGTGLTNLTLPNSVTTIRGRAFMSCKDLTSIQLPNTLTYIGEDVFDDCSSSLFELYDNAYYVGNNTNPYLYLVDVNDNAITSCNIHDNTRLICDRAFENCETLKDVVISKNIIGIGGYAFQSCTNLIRISLLPTTVPTLQAGAFNNINENAIFYCPASTINNYKTASNWEPYVNIYSFVKLLLYTVSIHTGQELDTAMSYYYGLRKNIKQKRVLKFTITENNWEASNNDQSDQYKPKYRYQLTINGLSRSDDYLEVYMMIPQANVPNPNVYKRWDLGYNVSYEQSKIICYSNKKIAGNIIITSTDEIEIPQSNT